jgi:hypothetical protein
MSCELSNAIGRGNFKCNRSQFGAFHRQTRGVKKLKNWWRIGLIPN